MSGILESLGALHVGSERFSWGKCSPQAANGVCFFMVFQFGRNVIEHTPTLCIYIYIWLFICIELYMESKGESFTTSAKIQNPKVQDTELIIIDQ